MGSSVGYSRKKNMNSTRTILDRKNAKWIFAVTLVRGTRVVDNCASGRER